MKKIYFILILVGSLLLIGCTSDNSYEDPIRHDHDNFVVKNFDSYLEIEYESFKDVYHLNGKLHDDVIHEFNLEVLRRDLNTNDFIEHTADYEEQIIKINEYVVESKISFEDLKKFFENDSSIINGVNLDIFEELARLIDITMHTDSKETVGIISTFEKDNLTIYETLTYGYGGRLILDITVDDNNNITLIEEHNSNENKAYIIVELIDDMIESVNNDRLPDVTADAISGVTETYEAYLEAVMFVVEVLNTQNDSESE